MRALEGAKVAAPFHVGEVEEVGKALGDLGSGGEGDLLGKPRKAGQHLDLSPAQAFRVKKLKFKSRLARSPTTVILKRRLLP